MRLTRSSCTRRWGSPSTNAFVAMIGPSLRLRQPWRTAGQTNALTLPPVQTTSEGDERALCELVSAHRDRLKRMIAQRLSRRLVCRVDESDALQVDYFDRADYII